MKLSEGKEQFLLDCRARRLTCSTVRCYDYNLRAFIGAVGDVEVESVTPAMIREHLVWMREQVEQDGTPHYSECTVHHRYVGLRAFFRWMAREVRISDQTEHPIRSKPYTRFGPNRTAFRWKPYTN